MVFFLLGILLYSLVPTFGHIGSIPLFVGAFCVIISMYGGGFRDHPGLSARYFRHHAGRRHSWRLLTAWSVAGVLGPVLVNYIRAYQIDQWRAQGAGVLGHHVHHVRPAADRLPLQFRHACGRSKYHYQGWTPARGPAREQVIMKARLGIHVARGRNSAIVGCVEYAAKCFEIISITRRAKLPARRSPPCISI